MIKIDETGLHLEGQAVKYTGLYKLAKVSICERKEAMRDIKFRVYVEKINTMCDVISIDFLNREVLITIDEARASQYIYKFENINIMQYTGLKDMNSTSIYEGDIIKYYQADFNCDTELYEDRVSYVEWYNDSFALINITEHCKNITPFPIAKLKVIEVIGNVYENKELLND